MSDMPRPRWPNLVKETTRHGRIVWYVRIGQGPRTRISADFGSAEFQREYDAIMRGERRALRTAGEGSLRWLWDAYRKSAPWAALSPATRRQRENIARRVLETGGAERYKDISRRHIQAGIDRRSATPFAARNFVETMRGLFAWAVDVGLISASPCDGIKVRRPGTKGFPEWTSADMDAFEARWPLGTRERVAYAVLAYTGLRRGDAVRLGRQHIGGDMIRFTTEKTGARVALPVLPELIEAINAGPCGDLTFIAGERGLPMVKESFGTWFREACRAAGVAKSSHGLRKAAAARAAENGATLDQLKALFGWSDNQTPGVYTRSAETERLAKAAGSAMSRNAPRTSIPAPFDPVRDTRIKPK